MAKSAEIRVRSKNFNERQNGQNTLNVELFRIESHIDSLFMSLVELEKYKQSPSISKRLENPAANIMECYKSVSYFLQELDVDDPVNSYLSQRNASQ